MRSLFLRSSTVMKHRFCEKSVHYPLQQDFTSCGAYVCMYAKELVKDMFKHDTVKFTYKHGIRKELAMDILTHIGYNLEQMDCRKCGRDEPLDDDLDNTHCNLINCDQCETWFHKTCLGLPDTLKPMPFLCGWCQSPSTCDKLQQKSQVHLPARSNRVTSAEDEEPFFLEERALKNCRKCSGCKKNFSPKHMVTKKENLLFVTLKPMPLPTKLENSRPPQVIGITIVI